MNWLIILYYSTCLDNSHLSRRTGSAMGKLPHQPGWNPFFILHLFEKQLLNPFGSHSDLWAICLSHILRSRLNQAQVQRKELLVTRQTTAIRFFFLQVENEMSSSLSDWHQHGLCNAWPFNGGSGGVQMQTGDAVESKGSPMSGGTSFLPMSGVRSFFFFLKKLSSKGFYRRQLLSIWLLLSCIKFCQPYTDTGGAASKRLQERKREVGETSPFGARTGRYQSAPQHLQFLWWTRV